MLRRFTGLAGLAALVAVSASLVVATSPADAETGGRGYERGNAPAAIDITWLHATNADRRFAIQVKVRDLGTQGRFSFHYWAGRKAAPPDRSLLLVVRHDEQGGPRGRFLTCDREECAPAPCRSFRATWNRAEDVVRVSARQRCFPGRTPSVGRFFAWSETSTDQDPGSKPFLLRRG